MNPITIDFNNLSNQLHKVESFTLSSDSKKDKFFFGLLSKEIKIMYKSVSIENVQIPSDLTIGDKEGLLKLQFIQNGQESEGTAFQNLNINSFKQIIHVVFDESQIKDCNASQIIYQDTIHFDIVFVPGNNGAVKTHHIALNIICKRAESEAKYNLTIHEEFLSGKEYIGLPNVEIGYIELASVSPYNFSGSLDKCDFSVDLEDLNLKNVVSFDTAIATPSDTFLKFKDSNSIASVVNLVSNEELKIPIIFDFSQIKNPSEAISIKGKILLKYVKNNITIPQDENFSLLLLPDTTTAALYAEVSEGGLYRRLTPKENIPEQYIWKGVGKSGKTNCFTIRLGNIAKSGDGGVQIQDFKVDFSLNSKSSSPITAVGEDLNYSITGEDDLNSFFEVNGVPAEELPALIHLPNQVESEQDFKIGFRHDKIGAIPKDIATVNCKVKFKFGITTGIVDDSLKEPIIRSFESEIVFKIEKYTGNYWLAIDFGTSATVAAFTNGANIAKDKKEGLLVDLQAPLRNYIKNYETAEIHEKGSPFLSSEILLRQGSSKQKAIINSTNYLDDIVELSPSIGKAIQNLHLKVPFLKSLIGLEYIPVFNEKLNNYEYYIRDNEQKLTFKENPIKVNTLLSNTYKSLVRDFINPQIGDHEQLNKIIISVPNTFTPMHLDLIRSLILDRFQKFRKDYIYFISESDAVACNYLVNWQDYNFERNIEPTRQKSEHVLVYDIGAGTTDLTYFSIHQLDNGKKEVEIIGRLGKATAGNYLDFVIAKIIDFEFNPEDKLFNFTEPGDEFRSVAHKLKIFIRNFLKPKLSNNESFRVYIDPQSGIVSEDDDGSGIEFDCSKILEHDLMKFYLKRNAEDLISEFFSLFQTLPDGTKLEKGAVPIDTVIFTGRTIQFQELQNAIRKSIEGWSRNPVYFTPIKETEELKNVVVKGALEYALRFRKQQYAPVHFKNRNLLARYGVLYTDPDTFKWQFKEFLNPSTPPINEDPKIIDGLTIYEYDTKISNALGGDDSFINLSATPTGLFVQSFSSDTARDANESNWEYITVMFSFDQDEVASSANIEQVNIRIIINARNEMKVSIGNFDDGLNAPLRMDLVENQTFRESMWPYL